MSEPFTLPRQERRPHGDSRATADDLTGMENRIMAALEEAVASLQQAVNDANSRFQNVGELENAIAAEREKYDALVSAEAAEDVEQEQELNDARATTDAALAQLNAVAGVLTGLTEQVNTLGRTASEATADATAPTDAAAPEGTPTMTAPDEAASTDNAEPEVNQVETTAPTDTTTDTLNDNMPNAPTPGDTPADVGTTAAAADSEETGSADVTPTDTGAADSQVADNAAPGPSAVDNANQNPNTSTDPTDVSNMRPNL